LGAARRSRRREGRDEEPAASGGGEEPAASGGGEEPAARPVGGIGVERPSRRGAAATGSGRLSEEPPRWG